MLRLPRFQLRRPSTLDDALACLAEAGPRGKLIAGGTDLIPNMKHGLITPATVIALSGIPELSGIRRDPDGGLVIGAMTTIAEVAANKDVQASAPSLAQAASLVASPQIRRMGTIGGNILLDTRCQWYNQSSFWRSAVGFCLKQGGTACHVVAGGSRCVAAASNDTAPALMTLGASLEVAGQAGGRRRVSIERFWTVDGARNHCLGDDEILVSVRIPKTPAGHRGAYGKLRDRGAIDYPLLGVAVRLDLDGDGLVERSDVVVTALAAAPKRVTSADASLRGVWAGTAAFADQVDTVADAAFGQCHPIENIPGDAGWRREMIRVYVRRTLEAAAAGGGPVHHL
ncbi:MAG: FAD binding domain-containing protein [Acidobacteria bacterium]|nr:FAD binding domain-containing protein [Acidobacteriota bacterium]